MDNKALFNIGYGLYVLTARDGERDNGCIINTVMQVTSDPVIAVIGVNKQNYTHDMILKTKQFNTSVLTEKAPFEVFERFGYHLGKNTHKFADYNNAVRSENGIYYLPEYTNSYLSYEVIGTEDYGTHTLFKAAVKDAIILSKDLSVTYTYYQANIKPKPQPTQKSGWRCKICGYVYEGEELPPDFICPICKHGAVDFEKI